MKCKNCVVGLFGVCHNLEYCRTERRVLIEQAQQLAEQYGHELAEFVKVRNYAAWESCCTHCGQVAGVNINPALNEPNIYGEAVTNQCSGQQKTELSSTV